MAIATCVVLAACVSPGGGTSVAGIAPSTPTVDALKKRFDYHQDKLSGRGWYTVSDGLVMHYRRKRIEPVVSSTGTIYLKSVYRGTDWLFHDQAKVRIGDRILTTSRVPSYSKNNTREVLSGANISEAVSYLSTPDEQIIREIAEAPADVPIVVQLVGRDHVHTMDMPASDRSIFTAAWQLAAALRASP